MFSSTNVRTIMHKVAKAATLPWVVAKPSYLWVSWALFMDKIPIFIVRMRLSFYCFLMFHSCILTAHRCSVALCRSGAPQKTEMFIE